MTRRAEGLERAANEYVIKIREFEENNADMTKKHGTLKLPEPAANDDAPEKEQKPAPQNNGKDKFAL